jgi:hypothetical protein
MFFLLFNLPCTMILEPIERDIPRDVAGRVDWASFPPAGQRKTPIKKSRRDEVLGRVVTTFRTRGHHGRFRQRTSVIITTTTAWRISQSVPFRIPSSSLDQKNLLETHGLELARSLLGIAILPPPVSLSVATSRSPVGAVSTGTSLPGRRLGSDGLLVGLGDDLAGEVEELEVARRFGREQNGGWTKVERKVKVKEKMKVK